MWKKKRRHFFSKKGGERKNERMKKREMKDIQAGSPSSGPLKAREVTSVAEREIVILQQELLGDFSVFDILFEKNGK